MSSWKSPFFCVETGRTARRLSSPNMRNQC
jgi:hypothetical protein